MDELSDNDVVAISEWEIAYNEKQNLYNKIQSLYKDNWNTYYTSDRKPQIDPEFCFDHDLALFGILENPKWTDEDIIKMIQLGFHFNDEHNCWGRF